MFLSIAHIHFEFRFQTRLNYISFLFVSFARFFLFLSAFIIPLPFTLSHSLFAIIFYFFFYCFSYWTFILPLSSSPFSSFYHSLIFNIYPTFLLTFYFWFYVVISISFYSPSPLALLWKRFTHQNSLSSKWINNKCTQQHRTIASPFPFPSLSFFPFSLSLSLTALSFFSNLHTPSLM